MLGIIKNAIGKISSDLKNISLSNKIYYLIFVSTLRTFKRQNLSNGMEKVFYFILFCIFTSCIKCSNLPSSSFSLNKFKLLPNFIENTPK